MSLKIEKMILSMMENINLALEVNPAATGRLIEQTRNQAYRHFKTATAPEDMERVTYEPTRGPKLSFTGRKLYEDEYKNISIELCQTEGGRLVLFHEWPTDRGDMHSIAGAFDQHLEVMEALHWSYMARTMAKKLGWGLIVEID